MFSNICLYFLALSTNNCIVVISFYLSGQLLSFRWSSRASNSQSTISPAKSSSSAFPNSGSTFVSSARVSDACTMLIEASACMSCRLSVFSLEVTNGLRWGPFLGGVSNFRVGVSISNIGLSIDSNSSLIFSRESNSSLILSSSFLDEKCRRYEF